MPLDDFFSLNEPEIIRLRARKALPILVDLAQQGLRITYGRMAMEIETKVFLVARIAACAAKACKKVQEIWQNEGRQVIVPNIDALVVKKDTELPSDVFFELDGKAELTDEEKRIYYENILNDVFSFEHWDDVLNTIGLVPFSFIEESEPEPIGGGGEGPERQRLKNYFATRPSVVGFDDSFGRGDIELSLLSGDVLDVSFRKDHVQNSVKSVTWVAMVVKAASSSQEDIIQGIFQCVKYKSVMEATLICEEIDPNNFDVEVYLVLGGKLEANAIKIKNLHRVKVIENVSRLLPNQPGSKKK
ncbi:MAG: hypothetical protein LBI10_11775 [Deltaproteobacteria bacterium]|jgi:hypothetical protein|nr:hypothetical protein [Deltaproteobacteria bacterium]